jgi:Rps23 Pro-64 3,4-dihydroxylase Tpa1-like proline 4-hydroxylase
MEPVNLFKNFVDKETAKEIVDFIENNLHLFHYNESRKRYMMRFGYDEELPEQAIRTMYPVKDIFHTLNIIFDQTQKLFDEGIYLTSWFLSKQIPGAKLLPHKDGAEGMNDHLEYTAMLYLNTLNDNGSISFPELNMNITPELGDLIVFKSLEHEHMVHDVAEDRYSLPMWFTKKKELEFERENIY